MDFYKIKERSLKKGVTEIYPDFRVKRSADLMVRGKSFYAIWNEEEGIWSTDEYEVAQIVDSEMMKRKDELSQDGDIYRVCSMCDYSLKSWSNFQNYLKSLPENYHELDTKLTFLSDVVTKKDYVSRRLPYDLSDAPCPAWDELVGTLYSPENRAKIEWAIGSIVSGDSRDIQKFIVFYGEGGKGKSTILKVIQALFEGYCTTFDAKSLVGSSNAFATEVFRENPLVAIQEDGDLSRIEDNSKLNSIVSHENMVVNEKYKASYTSRANCFLFMATNKPVMITDARSGLIRRLIDVEPTGNTIPTKRYFNLMSQVMFELGAIASHCLDIYQKMGKNYYAGYKPLAMMMKTDPFYNFVEFHFDIFKEQDGVPLKQVYNLYRTYCESAGAKKIQEMYKVREELKPYFEEFYDSIRIDGHQVRSYFKGFKTEKFTSIRKEPEKQTEPAYSVKLEKTKSLFDEVFADCPAQYATKDGTPQKPWADVKTKLRDIDTKREHYVMLPKDYITIDFDLKEGGKKSPAKNKEAAEKWPQTYAEYSKSGCGIHLTYHYPGDISLIDPIQGEEVEAKLSIGKSALRRKLSYCNDIPIAELNGGLKLKQKKEDKKMFDQRKVDGQEHLRNCILMALRKEVKPGKTVTCCSYILSVLQEAQKSGMDYDVRDLRKQVLHFAMGSTNSKDVCLKYVSQMPFCSGDIQETEYTGHSDERLCFYDMEVYPNHFLVCYKFEDDDHIYDLTDPTMEQIEQIMSYKLVGFNCRRYDNHILYGAYLGKTPYELYLQSQGIIQKKDRDCFYGEAWNLSYTDILDFSSKKQSLKKFEIELEKHHQEMPIPWDQPVPDDMWPMVIEYCKNDVIATEAVFFARKDDWMARKILADIAGMSVNSTTNSLTTKIVFEGNKYPQASFNYRNMGDISKIATKPEGYDDYTGFDLEGRPIFPGYVFDNGKSFYRDEEVGEGGYVYAEPGIYRNVALLDIASMHPSSIVAENLFGTYYTDRFHDLLNVRLNIKHKDYEAAGELFGGKLKGYLTDKDGAKALSSALKIAINSVYGLTSASFDNPFHDPRNRDNIVAKRGALFMINLKHEVQKRGFTVAHIKTDSIKIPNATDDIIQFVMDYGKLYGYNFEHEATYDRLCLVNDAVYIAKDASDGHWTATGKQFQVPYVFKTLFSKEPLEFRDFCETKSVDSGDLYIHTSDGSGDLYTFVGRVGSFCPMLPESGAGELVVLRNGKYDAVTGTKGYLWMEAEVVKDRLEELIDKSYYAEMARKAVGAIDKYGSYENFVSDNMTGDIPPDDTPPWFEELPCGCSVFERATCFDCPYFHADTATCDKGYSLSRYLKEE